MSISAGSMPSGHARRLPFARINGANRLRSLSRVLALVALLLPASCTGSPETLALQPDFAMTTTTGLVGVNVRGSVPGVTDRAFVQMVRTGMARAAPDAVVPSPAQAPFPRCHIVWHVQPDGPDGASRLVVNIFNASGPFAYEQAVVEDSAPRPVIVHVIESMTTRLMAVSAADGRAGQAG
jgi:hypothetical protein